MHFHPLHTDISLPKTLNNPFYYEPHPLCIMAAKQVEKAINDNKIWQKEVDEGKMFGVLVVRNEHRELGYLAAYSGQILGRSDWEGFVPAVFDYLQPNGYFKIQEQKISQINKNIEKLESSDEKIEALNNLNLIKNDAQEAIDDYKESMAKAKINRDLLRENDRNNCDNAELIQQSQYMKAELKRRKKHYSDKILEQEKALNVIENKINTLKKERKKESDCLQNWLFQHFVMLNARGEKQDLINIFADLEHRLPPAGAGECCAPKLLQYAYQHRMQPICMAEFWWGMSPKTELRTHFNYYPACQSKCKPILSFMLQGLNVEPNELENQDDRLPFVVYEDDFLAAINKPAGMLSVHGKSNRRSVADVLPQLFPQATDAMVAHRLDMHTSGLLLIAKNMSVYKALQAQFAAHTVQKKYVALLNSSLENVHKKGEISLPLCADIMDRPRQKVDFEHGKTAITEYEILEVNNGKTRVALYPHTGRTHQLRIHCAHPLGLGCPIVGDTLYGVKSDRLYLHAEEISFTHPNTGKVVKITSLAEF